MEGILQKIIVLAAIGEAVWQSLKMVWEKKETADARGKFNPDKLGVLAIGILVAFGSGLDLLAAVGIPMTIPYLGIVLTGILLSRGAGFVHDLLTYLKSLKEILLNKADNANLERNKTALKLDPSNLPKGTTISVSTPGVVSKTKDMISNLAEKTDRVIKVIRSSPEVKTEIKQPDSVDTPPAEGPEPEISITEIDEVS